MTTNRTSFDRRQLQTFRDKIERMPDVVKTRIRGALEKGGIDLTNTMKTLVPTDQGELKETIEFYFPERQRGEQTYRGEQLSIKGDAGLAIVVVAGASSRSGKDGFYAKFVEFGHAAGGVFGNGADVPASPFFFPAYRMRRNSIRSRITREMRKGIAEFTTGVG